MWTTLNMLRFAVLRTASRKAPHRRRPAFRRLLVEALEDRLVPSTFTVRNLNDSGDGSLRQTIIDALAAGAGNQVVFDNGVAGAINLATALPGLTKDIDIEGPGANVVTVERSTAAGTPKFGIFTVNNSAVVTLAGLTIANGAAAVGGGIDSESGSLTVNACTITGNTATDEGGGIWNQGVLTVNNCAIVNNVNASGEGAGGIDSEGGSVTISNTTISGNQAINSHSAGGVGIYGGTATIDNSTIANNVSSGPSSGGIDSFGNSAIVLFDTIVAGNTGGNGYDVVGKFSSQGHNLIGQLTAAGNSQATGLTNGVNGDQVGSAATPLDAGLGPLEDNGGPTPTQAVLAGSPARDAGDGAGAPAADQRGQARIVNGVIDIGAYEAPTPGTTVTRLTVIDFPSTTIAGQPQHFLAFAADANGQIVTGYAGAVQFTSTDPQAVLPFDYTFPGADQGRHAFSAILATVGTASLTATDANQSAITGSQAGINVVPFPAFAAPVTATFSATGAGSLTIGDFNGDGNQDIAFVDSNEVAVMLGNGAGGFTQAPGSPITANIINPGSIIAVDAAGHPLDFNGDGKSDLVVEDGAGATLHVLLGDGTGRFTEAPGSPFGSVGFEGMGQVVAADFNGDGKLDLAAVTSGSFSANDGSVSVFLGDGTGGFTEESGSPFAINAGSPLYLAAGDLNGDGKPDLVVADRSGAAFAQTVTVLLNNGSGAFTPAAGGVLNVPTGAQGLILADFNGDHNLDLAVSAYITGSTGVNPVLYLFLGDGNGGFTAASGTPFSADGDGALASADFNNDGKLDLAINNSSGSASIWFGNGAGAFTPALGSPYVSVNAPRSVAVADFTGDGKPDLVTVGVFGDIAVLPNQVGIPQPFASRLIVGGYPASTPVGGTHNVTVTATALDGTTVITDYTGVVHFTSSDIAAGLPGEYTFVASDHGQHTFSVTLNTAGTQSISATDTVFDAVRGSETGIIVAEAAQPGQLGFSAASYSATEGGANATITVNRTNGSSGSVTVAYATGGGTAVAGQDYTSTSGTLTFADGVTSQSFTVPILNNGQTGGSETLNLTLSNPTGGATLASTSSAVLTLQNNSSTSLASQLHFSVASARVPRTASSAVLTIVRTGGTSATETVQYATSDGTAKAGTDYTAISGTLTFAPGVSAQTISLPILNDGQNNGDESLILTLSNPTGGATLDSPIISTLTINDPFPQQPLPSNLTAVANIFTRSSEAFSLFVTNAYRRYLKRLPDPKGLAYWIDQLQHQGLTDEKLETGFLSSHEYIASHGGTGSRWVVGMYQDLLGRNPDPSGLAYWTNVLSTGGSAYSVAYGFAASAERERQRIAGDYEIYLGRQLDAAGQAYWVNQFLNGARNEDVVAGFVGSLEYYQNPDKGQTNHTAWIDSVFQDVLHRDPSASDLAFWLTQLI